MLLEAPKRGERNRAGPFHGSSDALAIAELTGKVRPLLVLTANAADAQRLKLELPFFAPELSVCVLPDWETLPYDHFSPHHDLVSERLATLYRMLNSDFDVALVPVVTALSRLMPADYLAGNTFFFKQGGKLAPDTLRRQLTIAGYTHVTQVIAPGEYSYRGGLIDLFPMGSTLPYRIDLFDNEIDTIRSFDVDTCPSRRRSRRPASGSPPRTGPCSRSSRPRRDASAKFASIRCRIGRARNSR